MHRMKKEKSVKGNIKDAFRFPFRVFILSILSILVSFSWILI